MQAYKTLCQDLGVSDITLRRAFTELSSENYIKRINGKGTFVEDRQSSPKVTNKIYNISLIIPQLGMSSFYDEILAGVEEEVFNRNYRLMLFNTRECIERESLQLDRVLDETSDGTIFISHSNHYSHYSKLEELAAKSALVTVDIPITPLSSDHVTTDNSHGIYEAIRHLASNNKKRIALITKAKSNTNMDARKEAYLNALAENNLTNNPPLIYNVLNDDRQAFDEISDLLKSSHPDAILATTEKLTIASYKAAKANNLALPQDLSIIGFGSHTGLHIDDITLSGIVQPAMDLGKKAVQLLADKITGCTTANNIREIVLPAFFRVGDS